MTAYTVRLERSAEKELAHIPEPYRSRIARHIDCLADNPRPEGCKALQGKWKGLHRIRVGEYRVVYQVQDCILLVLVVRIGSRGSAY